MTLQLDLMSPFGGQTRCSWAQRVGQTARSMHKPSMHGSRIMWNADDILFMQCYGCGYLDTGPAEPAGPTGTLARPGKIALLQGSVAQERILASNLGSMRYGLADDC